MYERTLEALLNAGNSEYAREVADYMVIRVEGATPEPEVIINSKLNFESKLNYYSKAYDEDLRLKANPDIRIVSFNFIKKADMGRFALFM
jgi:hypothetical protein